MIFLSQLTGDLPKRLCSAEVFSSQLFLFYYAKLKGLAVKGNNDK